MTLRPRIILGILFTIDILLVVLFLATRPLRALVDSDLVMFDVNAEPTFITWYSILKLFTVALFLFSISRVERAMRVRWWRHWAVLGAVFLFLSLDEFLQLHERLASPTRELLGIASGPLYLAWVIPGVILVLAVASLFLRFVLAQPRELRLLILVSAAIFVGSALGLEVVASAGVGLNGMTSAFEELGEMVGISLFAFALLRRLAYVPEASITVHVA